MNHTVTIHSDIVQKAFRDALASNNTFRGNFYHEIRQSFKTELENILIAQGIQVIKNSSLGSTNLHNGKQFESKPILNKDGSSLGFNFCLGYGHDDYSLGAVNYLHGKYSSLPSLLPFIKYKDFSIGNIAILVNNDNYDIIIKTSLKLKIVGYSTDISSRKRKSYLCIIGIRFDYSLLKPIINKYSRSCVCDTLDLDEIRIETIHYPIFFICRKCGQLFTCNCFKKYFNIKSDFSNYFRHSDDKALLNQINKVKFRNNICHLCTKNTPKLYYGSDMYYSSFMQRYLPYHELLTRQKYSKDIETSTQKLSDQLDFCRKNIDEFIKTLILNGKEKNITYFSILPPKFDKNDSYLYDYALRSYIKAIRINLLKDLEANRCKLANKDIILLKSFYNAENEYYDHIKNQKRSTENELRKNTGYPPIGEKWISETMLYKIIQNVFSDSTVIFHYRGKELEGLEIDIWMPILHLGIEYQGEQHFKPISHWGGKEGLRKRIENDKKKKLICKKLGYNLIEFKYNEDITEEYILRKLQKYIKLSKPVSN